MNTVNKKEIEKFSKIADEWWNVEGKFKPLHKFNPLRIKYIKEKVMHHFNINSKSKPLKNIELLDIGCGGGLLSEPMCRLGAKVTGIDASQKNIYVASYHSKKNKLKINYLCSSPEKIKLKKKFDVILNMEVVEHVDDLNLFLKKSSLMLKKNGLMFISTLNKTLKSYVFAIIGAEYVLKWLPVGTHDWNKFVKPEELVNITKNNNLELIKIDGVFFNLLKNEWMISKDQSVNYITQFKKI
jgi:2-polyprenyl-6-hydroxyphenyl methylase/3-demethylubiquinone-9 3-methyltransferase